MYNRKSPVILIAAFLAFCCFPVRTHAQKAGATPTTKPTPTPAPSPTPAPIEIIATPSQISVSAVRGAIETRRVFFTATGAVKDLKIVPLDLARSDDQAVIPATAVNPHPPANRINANDSMVVPFSFDLRDVGSGEFKGEIRMQYQGGKLTIPVIVRVKDRLLPPLLTLLLGIGLSLIVTRYLEKGKPRDEILKRIGEARAQMNADPSLDENFRTRLDALLIDTTAALNAEKWEDARKSIEAAEAVMNRWRKGRDDWRKQLSYRNELFGRLKDFGEPDELPPYLLTVRRSIEDAGISAPDLAGPDKLREKLDALAQQLNRYTQLHGQLQTLSSLIDNLEAQESEWRSKTRKWKKRLENLSPEDKNAYDDLRNEIESGIDQVRKLIEQQQPSRAKSKGESGIRDELTSLNLLAPAPSARALEAETIEDAGKRLKWFKWATYALALLFLAGTGFGELYITKPTFGANRWTDYFALLAWGFGAEATRAAVTGLMKSWGVAGMK